MKNNAGLELAENLTNFVNNFNCDSDSFIEGFCRQHRTLQQSSMRLILKLIEKVASDEYYTDGRNVQSAEIAKKLLRGFENETMNEMREQGTSERLIKGMADDGHLKPSRYLGSI